jgi:NADH-quinone oxidoreductase subunit I
MTNEYELSSPTREGLVYDKPDLLAPVPAGAKAPPHADAEDGPPTIARYGPQASLSQESVEPVWALLRQQETRQADRELPDDEAVPK